MNVIFLTINSSAFGQKLFNFCLLTSKELKKFQPFEWKYQLIQNKSDAAELTSYVSLYHTSEVNPIYQFCYVHLNSKA